ncbi:MAG: hypothetical protein JWL65_7212, partial [Gammaproteobacteria bacterium]|nr:hypothetical protein [Gammaproteobacteria bacterium]
PSVDAEHDYADPFIQEAWEAWQVALAGAPSAARTMAPTQDLRETLRDVCLWLKSALGCKEWVWELDQRLAAMRCLEEAEVLLSSPAETPAAQMQRQPETIAALLRSPFAMQEVINDYHRLEANADAMGFPANEAVPQLDARRKELEAYRNDLQIARREEPGHILVVNGYERTSVETPRDCGDACDLFP